jgi:hypothetical protein
VYTGPTNMHGMKIHGHVLSVSNNNQDKVKFTDNVQTTRWVKASSIEYEKEGGA